MQYGNRQRARGVTIVEIMVALAVAAVMFGLAGPAFQAFVAQRTLTTQLNDFVVATQYARSEAGRRGGLVSVQALDAGDNANEWGPGWCVTLGDPGDCVAPLRTFPPLGTNTLDADGALDGVDTLSFNARGALVANPGGVLTLCNPDETVGRRITLSGIGRVSTTEIDCP